jgi:hypothetical protein
LPAGRNLDQEEIVPFGAVRRRLLADYAQPQRRPGSDLDAASERGVVSYRDGDGCHLPVPPLTPARLSRPYTCGATRNLRLGD